MFIKDDTYCINCSKLNVQHWTHCKRVLNMYVEFLTYIHINPVYTYVRTYVWAINLTMNNADILISLYKEENPVL